MEKHDIPLVEDLSINNYRSPQDTPWYYGAYLNLAVNNIFLLVNHLHEKFPIFGFKPLGQDRAIRNDHILTKIFDPRVSSYHIYRYKVFTYLVKRHYLPIVKYFHAAKGRGMEVVSEVDYEGLHKFMNQIFSILIKLRDMYSHAIAINDNGQNLEVNMPSIGPTERKVIKGMFKEAPQHAMRRFQYSSEEEHYAHLDLYQMFEDNHRPTEHGLYFITCLFLGRGDAMRFLKKIRGFKNDSIPPFKATLRAFMAYAPKRPDVRMDSADIRFSLVLDMLNELHKCPKGLFHRLDEKDQLKMVPSRLSQNGLQELLDTTEYGTLGGQAITRLKTDLGPMLRHGDRFPYFVLRFLDEMDVLPNIRFQIMVGRLITDRYPKTVLGKKEDRPVTKQVRAFGKLSDFLDREEQALSSLKPSLREHGFDQYHPHYNIKNNNIHFALFKNNSDGKMACPDFDGPTSQILMTGCLSIHELAKLAMLALLDPNSIKKTILSFDNSSKGTFRNKKYLERTKEDLDLNPKTFSRRRERPYRYQGKLCYFSDADLLRLEGKTGLSKNILEKTHPDQLHSLTPKEREWAKQLHYRHLLAQRKEQLQSRLPDNISIEYLPKKIQEHLLSIESISIEKNMGQRIKAMRKKAQSRIDRIRAQKKLPTAEQNLQNGEMAYFLARDIMDMLIGEKTKKRATSPYFRKMQYLLAYFGKHKRDLHQLLVEMGLFDPDGGHAFLEKKDVLEARDLFGFHQSYLVKKVNWIKRTFLSKDKKGYNYPDHAKLPLKINGYWEKAQKNPDLDAYLDHLGKGSVRLPRGLFNGPVEKALQKELTENGISYGDKDRFSVLMEKWDGGDAQPFYGFVRQYGQGEKIRQLAPQGLSSKEVSKRYGKSVAKAEKELRFQLTKDRTLKWLCSHMLKRLGELKESMGDWALAQMMPNAEASPLARAARFEQVLPGSTIKVIAQDASEQKAQVMTYTALVQKAQKETFQGQKGYEWTYGDFGRFKGFFYDRRISGLAYYIQTLEIDVSFLEYQLQEYERFRDRIWEQVFRLENHLATHRWDALWEEERKAREEDAQEAFPKYQYPQVGYRAIKKLFPDGGIDEIVTIRNAFAHNLFPEIQAQGLALGNKEMETFDRIRRNRFNGNEIKEKPLSIPEKLYIHLVDTIEKVIEMEK